jgi:hypothetical protein
MKLNCKFFESQSSGSTTWIQGMLFRDHCKFDSGFQLPRQMYGLPPGEDYVEVDLTL